MRDPQGENTAFFYQFAIWCSRSLLSLFCDWRATGLENVPLRGPLLMVSNHVNGADPAILIGLMPRVVHYMAKQELFEGPIAPFSRRYGAFPVRRGEADRQALKTALEILSRGSCVGIFPEGTRSSTRALMQGQIGAGLVAVRSGAPILPIGIAGTNRLTDPVAILRRQRIQITFGKPFSLPVFQGGGRSAAAAVATETIMRRIAALLPPDQRGVYGDESAPAVDPGRRAT